MATSRAPRARRLPAARTLLLPVLLAACGAEPPPAPAAEPPPPAAPAAEPAAAAGPLTPEQVHLAIGEVLRAAEPKLVREIEVTFLALMDEEVTWRPIRGRYEAQVMREPIARRREIVVHGRQAFETQLAAIEQRVTQLLPAAEQSAAGALVQGLRQGYAAFFDILQLEVVQLDGYDEMLRIMTDPAQAEWNDGKGYFRSLQAGRRYDELDQQVRQHEGLKRAAMDRLQAKLARAGTPR